MKIIKYFPQDQIELRKPHPCGSHLFRVLRVGTEMRIVCEGCGRDMTVDRVKLEKATKRVLTPHTDTEEA